METKTRSMYRTMFRILCGIGIIGCALAWIEYRTAAQAQQARAADAAPGLPFQGRLLTPSGTPVTSGKWTALFSIYTAETGGESEWSSGNIPIDVKPGGFFSTLLGAPPSLPFVEIDVSQQLYVGVRIDNPGDGVTTANEPEMLPRIPLVPALHAHQSGNSKLLNGEAIEYFGTAIVQADHKRVIDLHDTRIKDLETGIKSLQMSEGAVELSSMFKPTKPILYWAPASDEPTHNVPAIPESGQQLPPKRYDISALLDPPPPPGKNILVLLEVTAEVRYIDAGYAAWFHLSSAGLTKGLDISPTFHGGPSSHHLTFLVPVRADDLAIYVMKAGSRPGTWIHISVDYYGYIVAK